MFALDRERNLWLEKNGLEYRMSHVNGERRRRPDEIDHRIIITEQVTPDRIICTIVQKRSGKIIAQADADHGQGELNAVHNAIAAAQAKHENPKSMAQLEQENAELLAERERLEAEQRASVKAHKAQSGIPERKRAPGEGAFSHLRKHSKKRPDDAADRPAARRRPASAPLPPLDVEEDDKATAANMEYRLV